jgi:uncharacterized RDD family membrane protein YckC
VDFKIASLLWCYLACGASSGRILLKGKSENWQSICTEQINKISGQAFEKYLEVLFERLGYRDMKDYGGFWIRVGAYAVDVVVMLIPVLIVRRLTLATLPSNMPYAAANFISSINQCMTWWVYFAVLESSEWQATLGKRVCGLRVEDEFGNRISFARATGRYFAKILSGLILGIGFIMVAFTRRKQGLHDLLAGTLVTRKQAASSTQYAGNRGFPSHATAADTKKCPACAETIKREAKKCRFCGEVLDPNLRMRNNDTQSNLFETCPKCNYKRQPEDDEFASKTECPKCGVIYEKFLESYRS